MSGLLQVIPCVALAIAYLGERLRNISKKANLSIATLSAYLNEVYFVTCFVTQNLSLLCSFMDDIILAFLVLFA